MGLVTSEQIDRVSQVSARRPSMKWLWIALRLLFTVLVLVYLSLHVDWANLYQRLKSANVGLMVLACLWLGVGYLFSGVRWWYLLRVQEIRVGLWKAIAVTFVGQFFNTFLLGAVGGDLVRMIYIAKLAPSQRTHATLTIFMDRALGLVILLFASVISICMHWDVLMARVETRAVALALTLVLALIVACSTALFLIPFQNAPAFLKGWWQRMPMRHIPELLLGGFRAHARVLEDTAKSVAAGFALTAFIVIGGKLLADALGLQVGYLDMLQILTVAICVTSLPISIGGHGLREAIFIYMFAAFGIVATGSGSPGIDAALLYSLCFFGLCSAWSVVGGVIYLFYRPISESGNG